MHREIRLFGQSRLNSELFLCAFLWQLPNNGDQWLVAGDAVEGETDLEVAFDSDGVGEFEGDLGKGERWEFADVFDDEGIQVMIAVFELDADGFAGQEIDAGREEHDAGAMIGAEVVNVC